jgi:hypothetical protein
VTAVEMGPSPVSTLGDVAMAVSSTSTSFYLALQRALLPAPNRRRHQGLQLSMNE